MILFWKILLMEFIAEMGDKTQLMLVAMTSKYKIKDIILGTAAAILVLNGIAVLAGGFVSQWIPTWLIRIVAALAFLFFALTSIGEEEEEKEETIAKKHSFAALTVFSTFFVAELGDKTQLTAITFGANEGMEHIWIVWLACSIGLFAADILGMLIGYLLKSKLPDEFLHILAFLIFSIFGIFTLRQGLGLLLGSTHAMILPITAIATVIFIILCIVRFAKQKKGRK